MLCYEYHWSDWLSNRYSLLFSVEKLRIFIEVIKPQFHRWDWYGASYGAELVSFQRHSAVSQHLSMSRHGCKLLWCGLFPLLGFGGSGFVRNAFVLRPIISATWFDRKPVIQQTISLGAMLFVEPKAYWCQANRLQKQPIRSDLTFHRTLHACSSVWKGIHPLFISSKPQE